MKVINVVVSGGNPEYIDLGNFNVTEETRQELSSYTVNLSVEDLSKPYIKITLDLNGMATMIFSLNNINSIGSGNTIAYYFSGVVNSSGAISGVFPVVARSMNDELSISVLAF